MYETLSPQQIQEINQIQAQKFITQISQRQALVAPGTLTLPLELPSRSDGLIIPAPNTVQILMTTPQFPRPKITLTGMGSYQALSVAV